jgi:Tfp pilus assembly protein PilO
VKKQIPILPVVAGAFVIVAVVAYWLLIHPKRAEAARLGDEIELLENQVRVATLNARKEETAVKIRVADLFALAKAMPDDEDMPGVILEVNATASAAGIEFVSIAPQTPIATATGYHVIPIALKFEGNYFDLTDFLFRLRNHVAVRDGRLAVRGRLFTLDMLDFHEGAGGFPHIEADLTVAAYVYGDVPTAATQVAAPAPTTTTATTTTTTTTGTP